MAEWVATHPLIPKYLLDDLYTVAEKMKEYPFALYSAKRRSCDYPSRIADANYALALVQVGKIDTGLSLLQDLYTKHPTDHALETIYLSALVEATKKNPCYRNRLITFMQTREKNTPLPPDLLKNFAYIYLDTLRDFSKATEAFQRLSETATPDSDVVQTLVYLWGPKISDQQAQWLEARAAASDTHALGIWLNHLLTVGRYESVLSLVERRCSPLEQEAYFAYLESLNQKKCPLRNVIDHLLDSIDDIKQLERLAIYAEEAEYLEAQRAIWEKSIALAPTPKRWEKLTEVALAQRDYTAALYALDQYFDPCSYKDLSTYAQILQGQECVHEARHLFWHALCALYATPPEEKALKKIEKKKIEAFFLYQIGKKTQALAILEELYTLTNADPNTLALWANMLMDAGQLYDAKELLGKPYVP